MTDANLAKNDSMGLLGVSSGVLLVARLTTDSTDWLIPEELIREVLENEKPDMPIYSLTKKSKGSYVVVHSTNENAYALKVAQIERFKLRISELPDSVSQSKSQAKDFVSVLVSYKGEDLIVPDLASLEKKLGV